MQASRSIYAAIDTSGRVIADGQETRGALTADDLIDADGRRIQVWRLDADAGARLRVSLSSRAIDAFVRVVGPGLGLGVEDDDSGPGLDALLCVEVPERGELRVVVASTDGSEGAFQLAVTRVADVSSADCSGQEGRLSSTLDVDSLPVEDRVIAVGQRVEGVLTADHMLFDAPAQAWALRASAGDTVTIDLRSTEFDAYLYVVGPGLEPLTDDDGAGGCDARVTLTVPESGLYRVVASAIGQTGGAFSMTAGTAGGDVSTESCSMSAPPTEEARIDQVPVVGALAIGTPVSGGFTGTEAAFQSFPSQAWTLTGVAGQRLAVTATASDLDTVLYLGGPGFSEPLMDDDSGGDRSPRICVVLPEDAVYTVIVGRYSSGDPGTYSLHAVVDPNADVCSSFDYSPEKTRAQLLAMSTDGRVLRLGETVAGKLADSDARVPDAGEVARLQAWRLEAPPGTTVWVDLVSDDFDPMVSVLGPSIEGIPSSDDYNDDTWNSRVEITVPDDGIVIIIVESYNDDGRGGFRLRATVDPPDLEINVGGGGGATSITERLDPVLITAITPVPDRVLSIGLEVDGTLEASDPVLGDDDRTRVQVWTLEARAGDRLVFEMESEEIDSVLFLAGPGIGDPLINDDGGRGLDSRLEVVLSESGTFRIYVGALEGRTGPFRLRVLRRRG